MIHTRPQAQLIKDVLSFAAMREDWSKIGKKMTKDIQFNSNAVVIDDRNK